MQPRFCAFVFVTVITAGFLSPARAAEPPATKPAAAEKKVPVYLTVESAGPEYKVQGEYAGQTDAKEKLGAQVAAQGDGAFRAVFYAGGLPGDGWDGKGRVEVKGTTADGKTTFAGGAGYAATITGGDAMTGQTDKGAKFELKKVMRVSATEGAKPPAGATVLFDGMSLDAFAAGAKMDERKLLMAHSPGRGPITRATFGDFTLHAEFLIPFKPGAKEQDHGNSGVYIQERYEVQILDSFGQPLNAGVCASVYRQTPPAFIMSYPPLSWQTYDIDFEAPRWDAQGKKVKNAVITVRHNGVLVHDKREVTSKTGAGKPEGPTPGLILLQNHGNPVFFRNVWIVDKKGA